tara:strand:- start:235 stop:759 length:525 start_codon:yes stop_codon:yes gene_type:complete
MANQNVNIGTIPEKPFSYQGKQVIINTDRVVLQSKKDSVLVFANDSISFSCNKSIHFDTGDEGYFIINTPKIVLGLKENDTLPTEPVLLGETTEVFLKDVLSAIDALCDILDGPENLDSAGDCPSPTLVSALKKYRKNFIKPLASRIGYKYDEDNDFEHMIDTSEISSKRVFTV